ncbi:MAG TPA: hypothetical protein VGN07_14535 [Steroidobacteraceae bacterium]|jgi:TPR repeat protein
MPTRRISSMAAAGSLLLLHAINANAIDAPKPAATPPPAPASPPSKVEVTPTDETAFYQRLQYVTQHRNLIGLKVADEVVKSLARGSVDMAVASLSSRAAAGDRDANIALVRIQHWCNRILSNRGADYQGQLARLATVLPPQRLARAAGVFAAEKPYQEAARQSCGKASFDYQGIETRLRQAADAGDPASATELSQFARDPAMREELLQQAADKNFPPAMYALASTRLVAVQRGQTTENVASIRLLLKQAGRALPKAKVDLANCMALGCDGHPADAPTAAAFGIDAARDGEPTAFLSMLRMPWGGRLTRLQLMAWQYYGDRLNEAGCTGDTYVPTAATYSQTLTMLEKGQPTQLLEQAQTEAEKLWQENSARAKTEQGCGE